MLIAFIMYNTFSIHVSYTINSILPFCFSGDRTNIKTLFPESFRCFPVTFQWSESITVSTFQYIFRFSGGIYINRFISTGTSNYYLRSHTTGNIYILIIYYNIIKDVGSVYIFPVTFQ